jgi:hypothetical protein
MLAYVLEALNGALDEVAVAAKESTALPGVSDGQALRVPGMSERVVLWTEPDSPRHPLAGLRHALQRAGDRPVSPAPSTCPSSPRRWWRRSRWPTRGAPRRWRTAPAAARAL